MKNQPKILCAAATHIGRVRSRNEDHLHADPNFGLLVIADGMGGHNAGHVASRLAIDSLVSYLHAASQTPLADPRDPELFLLEGAVVQANSEVFTAAAQIPGCHGMGTTLLAAWVHTTRQDGPQIAIAHVGDSRLYRYRSSCAQQPSLAAVDPATAFGELTQLTRDHTTLQDLIDGGFADAKHARDLIGRSYLTRALGIESEIKIDLFTLPINADDVLLLCSDGLTNMISDNELLALFDSHRASRRAHPDLQQLATTLIDAANARGGHDNISVALATLD